MQITASAFALRDSYPRTPAVALTALAMLLAAGASAQTASPQPRLVRNVTPAAWQGDRVPWSGDVSPANKIDDLIDSSAEATFAIVVNFKRCVRTADLNLLRMLTPQGTIQGRSKTLPSVFMVGISKPQVLAIARLPQVAFVERQVPLEATLGVAGEAIKVKSGFYSPNTVMDLDLGLNGSGVNIAILDTGVDDPGGSGMTHQTFRPAVHSYDATSGIDGNPDDTDGHGTWVASIALGRGAFVGGMTTVSSGVAPAAGLIDIQVLKGDTSNADAALQKLYDMRDAWQVDVVNMSFRAGGSDNGLNELSKQANLGEALGLVLVGTSANYGPGGGSVGQRHIPPPGSASRVITVAASYDKDTVDRDDDPIWHGSNYGPRDSDFDKDFLDELKPDLTAPGAGVIGAQFNTSAGRLAECTPRDAADCSGTSLAAPQVAGLAALIIQKARLLGRGRINPASVKQLLTTTAEPRAQDPTRPCIPPSGTDPVWTCDWGWGLVDGFAAISAMNDAARTADLTFPNFGKEPVWLSEDIETIPALLKKNSPATIQVRIVNSHLTLVAKNVRIQFGVHGFSASIPAFSDIGTLIVDLAPGVNTVNIPWTPVSDTHQCLEVEIGYGPDTNYGNNKAQRNLAFAKSPVIFQVQNTLSENPREIHFEATLDPPTSDWTVKITPASVVLGADDCPVDVEVLLEPNPGVPAGTEQRAHVAAKIGTVLLGGVTVQAKAPVVPDCNGNGILDDADIAGGGSQDFNGNGIPDECEIGTVEWIFRGTAQGGTVSSTIQGFSAGCTVTIVTVSGQSATDVATAFAAAVNSNACLAGQGIVAQASGPRVRVSGVELEPSDVTDIVTDPGLEHLMPLPIPTVSGQGALVLALLLLTVGVVALRRQRHYGG